MVQQNLCFSFEMDLTYSVAVTTVCPSRKRTHHLPLNKMNTELPTVSITLIAWAIKVYFVMVFFFSFIGTDVGIA